MCMCTCEVAMAAPVATVVMVVVLGGGVQQAATRYAAADPLPPLGSTNLVAHLFILFIAGEYVVHLAKNWRCLLPHDPLPLPAHRSAWYDCEAHHRDYKRAHIMHAKPTRVCDRPCMACGNPRTVEPPSNDMYRVLPTTNSMAFAFMRVAVERSPSTVCACVSVCSTHHG